MNYYNADSDIDWEYQCGRSHDTPPKQRSVPYQAWEPVQCPYCGSWTRWPHDPDKEYQCRKCY